jgi:hypothetical protein
VAMNSWLAPELERGLREVTAPPELWDRIQAPKRAPAGGSRRLAWALAAAVVLIAFGLSTVHRESAAIESDSQPLAFHCQNPAQLRAWVKARTGLDVPLRGAPPASIQLIGARDLGPRNERVEIAYRAGDRDALLLVSRASGAAVPHNNLTAKTSSWVMNGERFTLACDNPADLQLACKLCHLD